MKEFFKAAGIRALRTFVQVVLAEMSGAVIFSDVNWLQVGSAALFAALYSVLMSIATDLPEAPKNQAPPSNE